MPNEIQNILEVVDENNAELRNAYIDAIPNKMIELKLLEIIQAKIKSVKEEIKIMVNTVGEYENDFYSITKKTTTTKKVDYKDLDLAIKEIEQNLPQEQDQIDIYHKLVESMKKDIEVKKPSEKLKMLEKINPSQAQQITKTEIKNELVLKEKEALKEELDRKLRESQEENTLLS